MPNARNSLVAPRVVWGVDFSGAVLSGRTAWFAVARPTRGGHLRLDDLGPLGDLCGGLDRATVNAGLVAAIRASRHALWAVNFPFGLPCEALPDGVVSWPSQFRHLATWGAAAYAWGLACVARSQARGLGMHVRRVTDAAQRTPFDAYHYRIVYQTFHGMREVLDPLRRDPATCVLPFQPRKLATASRVVVESCPTITLRRLGLPSRNFKQPTGGPLTPLRRRNRREILHGLAAFIDIPPALVRKAMRDPGADGLDAIVSAVGAWTVRQVRVPFTARIRREGWHYA